VTGGELSALYKIESNEYFSSINFRLSLTTFYKKITVGRWYTVTLSLRGQVQVLKNKTLPIPTS